MSAQILAQDILAHLQVKGLPPTALWLSNFIVSQKSSTPVPALKQTAFFRIIQTDITKTIDQSRVASFAGDIHDASIRERRLPGPIPVQVVGVEDIGLSRWSQVEALEAKERGETTKGREIIRVVPQDDSASDPLSSSGPHKLLLQDVRGTCVYGIELSSVAGVGVGMSMGSKILLQNVAAARGVLLLEPKTTLVLGGRIEDLHQKWKNDHKTTLSSAAQQASRET